MKLNEKIVYCRKKAGLSQLDLADSLGVSRQSVSKWETGESNPDVTKIPQLAGIFGVTADWLLSEDAPEEADTAAEETPAKEAAAPQRAYPDWAEHLPFHLVTMVKKYGWICGVRIAVGGALFTALGCLSRFLFRKAIFASSPFEPEMPGGFPDIGTDIFTPMQNSFQESAWGIFSPFTGFIIGLGALITVLGVALAIALKKWGKKNA